MTEQAESAAVVCPDCGYGLRTLTVGCTCGWTPPKSETVEQADVYAARHGWSKALAERDAARAERDRLRAENQQARALCDSFHEAETQWIKKTADLQAECERLRAELAARRVPYHYVIPPLSDTEIKRLVDVARAVPSVPSDTRPGLHTVDMPGVVRAIAAQIAAPWRGPLTDVEWSELRHTWLRNTLRARAEIDALLTGAKEKSCPPE